MTRSIFYITFILLFLVGGIISFTGIIPIRMAYVVPLAYLVMAKHGIRYDSVAKTLVIFSVVIIASGIINNTSMSQMIIFLRFVIIPFGMYYLADRYINIKNIRNILNICIAVGMIQLPILVFQRMFYDSLIPHSAVFMIRNDFFFGSFFTGNDKALSLFLTGLILFLLYDTENNYFVKNRGFKVIWLTLSVFTSNSIISHVVLIGIWLYYFARWFNIKTLIRFASIGIVVLGAFTVSNYMGEWTQFMKSAVTRITFQGNINEEAFLKGGYSRMAAIVYYSRQPLKWLGDGPGKYFDPVTRTYEVGNRGQIFKLYSEVGLIGLMLGYLVLFSMTKKRYKTSDKMALPLFIATAALTVTTSVLTNAATMLAYNIFLRTNLVMHERMYLAGAVSRARAVPA